MITSPAPSTGWDQAGAQWLFFIFIFNTNDSSSSRALSYLIPTASPQKRCYCDPHFTDEDAEAQREGITCLKPQLKKCVRTEGHLDKLMGKPGVGALGADLRVGDQEKWWTCPAGEESMPFLSLSSLSPSQPLRSPQASYLHCARCLESKRRAWGTRDIGWLGQVEQAAHCTTPELAIPIDYAENSAPRNCARW